MCSGAHIPRGNTYYCNTDISAAKQLSKVCRDIPQFVQEILRQNVHVSSEQSLILANITNSYVEQTPLSCVVV